MSLTDRIDCAEWSEEARVWFAECVSQAIADPDCFDLQLAIVAALIGHDGAALPELLCRAREIVDLAVAMQAERGRGANPGPSRLTVVGGRDA